jgi:hypothetical protein
VLCLPICITSFALFVKLVQHPELSDL